MKQVLYYCDMCAKLIKNPKQELDCTQVTIAKTHDWTKDLPYSQNLKDIRVCGECGKKVLDFIEKNTESDRYASM